MNSKILVTIKRGGCEGTCPIYSAQIFEDGTVIYDGQHFVEIEGKRQYKISKGKVEKLIIEFQQVDYFSMKNKYKIDKFGNSVTCQPTVTTSIQLNGRRKQVANYFGAPDKLNRLQERIDKIARLDKFIGKEN